MAIFEIFSKRQKKLRGEAPDVYVYDEIPQQLKIQIIYIWKDALGDNEEYQPINSVYKYYQIIVERLCREYGCFRLPGAENRRKRHYLEELTERLSGNLFSPSPRDHAASLRS